MTDLQLAITCSGCPTRFSAGPDDFESIIAGDWCEDEHGNTWCNDCGPDDGEPFGNPERFQPIAEFPDGTVYSFPIPRDPWALLNRARYGCTVCDQCIDHDTLTGSHLHEQHLADVDLGADRLGRRVAV